MTLARLNAHVDEWREPLRLSTREANDMARVLIEEQLHRMELLLRMQEQDFEMDRAQLQEA